MPADALCVDSGWGRGSVILPHQRLRARSHVETCVSSSSGCRLLLDLFRSSQYLRMDNINHGPRSPLEHVSACQTVHSINTATVCAITTPENQSDRLLGGSGMLGWQRWRGALERKKKEPIMKTGNEWMDAWMLASDQMEPFNQQDPLLRALCKIACEKLGQGKVTGCSSDVMRFGPLEGPNTLVTGATVEAFTAVWIRIIYWSFLSCSGSKVKCARGQVWIF